MEPNAKVFSVPEVNDKVVDQSKDYTIDLPSAGRTTKTVTNIITNQVEKVIDTTLEPQIVGGVQNERVIEKDVPKVVLVYTLNIEEDAR